MSGVPHCTVEEASLVKQGHTALQEDHIGAQQVLPVPPSHPLQWCTGTVEYIAVMYSAVHCSTVQCSSMQRCALK